MNCLCGCTPKSMTELTLLMKNAKNSRHDQSHLSITCKLSIRHLEGLQGGEFLDLDRLHLNIMVIATLQGDPRLHEWFNHLPQVMVLQTVGIESHSKVYNKVWMPSMLIGPVFWNI